MLGCSGLCGCLGAHVVPDWDEQWIRIPLVVPHPVILPGEAHLRGLKIWDRVGPGSSGRSGGGSARTSGVDSMDWRRRGEGLSRVSAQRCVDSDCHSRIEIQQDGATAVADPEQAAVLRGPSDMEDEVLSVDS
ncbi:hypothetical protein NDU88_008623 [Pleurodeles waltl]|uniref:Uncharacterized protein n=1 Tax=Pleurodeles waltl TaxID=8319 RepID=A0AAV7RYK4_PLEWA|nr:hypothetical protein NDU88_008623 [Pleurodeles waltl]